MQQEVQSIQIRQLEALHRAWDHALKMPRNTCRRHLFRQDRVELRFTRDEADICRIALVARSRVGDVQQAHGSRPRSLLHASRISTDGSTICLSINAGQYATISSGFGRPPAKPVTLG